MSLEQSFLQALHDNPADDATGLILADYLEEQGDPRGELLRLTQALRHHDCPGRPALEQRLQALLHEGVCPCVPRLTNSIGMELALIPAGSYLQGSPPDEPERRSDEGPQRLVTITQPFYMGIGAVTQAEYEEVMHQRPAFLWRSNHPVEQVSWDDVMAFCERLGQMPDEFSASRTYRLPTEAEWEYACRAGTSTAYALGPFLDARNCNFDGNYPLPGSGLGPYLQHTCPAISCLPNAFGLYQMHGNVWEWCSDWYDAGAYRSPEQIDPQGRQYGWERVLRGGSWVSDGRECRSAQRGRMPEGMRDDDVGFRVVMVDVAQG